MSDVMKIRHLSLQLLVEMAVDDGYLIFDDLPYALRRMLTAGVLEKIPDRDRWEFLVESPRSEKLMPLLIDVLRMKLGSHGEFMSHITRGAIEYARGYINEELEREVQRRSEVVMTGNGPVWRYGPRH